MRKILIGAMLFTALSAVAQETYDDASIMKEDLNGSARYVGMGGAMEALGADLSVIATNPAGMGLFRRAQVAVTGGVVISPGAPSNGDVNGTKVSFDQAGFVWSNRMRNNKNLNFAFNYRKSSNFHGILEAADALTNASQNKLTAAKGYEGLFQYDNCYNQADYLNENVMGLYDKETGWGYFDAQGYNYTKSTQGYANEFSFNISGSVTNNFFLGLTVGVKSLNYEAFTRYNELYDANWKQTVEYSDHRIIKGSGANITLGAIIMPIPGSPFRIGASVQTPTWYSLNTQNTVTMKNNTIYGVKDYMSNNESYDFRLWTPWKFGVSLGHTIGNSVALGASYEYAGYSATKNRVLSGGRYNGTVSSYNDNDMNNHTKATLKGVHTVKLGAEFKVLPVLALRAGYNFVSGMYNMNGYRDGTINSPGTYYSSTTDYTNWKSQHRVTCGVGFTAGKFGIDVAYQFVTAKGEFAPFMSYNGDTAEESCIADVVNVTNKRHQVLATLSYKF